MMITFVSQCEKKAQARTRRVLDAFTDHKVLDFMFDQTNAITLKSRLADNRE
jgi:hypothetical protein